MQRKLVKQGAATLMISLPAKWAQKNNLDKGDSVDLNEKGSSLIIDAIKKNKKITSVKVNDEMKKDIKETLTFLYRTGYDEIILEDLDQKNIAKAMKITRDLLLGFEITHKTSNSITLENISEPTDQKFDIIVRRLFLILEELIKISESGPKDNWSKLEEISEMRYQVDRFALFCRRIITKESYDKNPILGWELISFFTLTSHTLDYLYNYASKNKIKTNPLYEILMKDLIQQLHLLSDAHIKSEISNLYKLAPYRDSHLFGKCIEYIEKSKGKEAVIASYVRELFRMLQIGINPILAELINKLPRTDSI